MLYIIKTFINFDGHKFHVFKFSALSMCCQQLVSDQYHLEAAFIKVVKKHHELCKIIQINNLTAQQ